MGKPSISMGFENRTTCCMCPPPLSPPRPPSPETTRPPLDTRADSFPRERWLQTVPNVFPDIGQKYARPGREREYVERRMCRVRNALRNINVPVLFLPPVTIDIADFCINATFVKRINYGFSRPGTRRFVKGVPDIQYDRPEGVWKTSKELRHPHRSPLYRLD